MSEGLPAGLRLLPAPRGRRPLPCPLPVHCSREPGFGPQTLDSPGRGELAGGCSRVHAAPLSAAGQEPAVPYPPPPRPARPGLRWMPAAGQVPAWCGRRSSAPGQPGATAKDAWLTFPLLAFLLRLVARGRRKGGHGPWPPPSLVPSSCTRSLEPLGAKPDRMCALNAAPSRGRERDGNERRPPAS